MLVRPEPHDAEQVRPPFSMQHRRNQRPSAACSEFALQSWVTPRPHDPMAQLPMGLMRGREDPAVDTHAVRAARPFSDWRMCADPRRSRVFENRLTKALQCALWLRKLARPMCQVCQRQCHAGVGLCDLVA